jgi:hypothetical protein
MASHIAELLAKVCRAEAQTVKKPLALEDLQTVKARLRKAK